MSYNLFAILTALNVIVILTYFRRTKGEQIKTLQVKFVFTISWLVSHITLFMSLLQKSSGSQILQETILQAKDHKA